MSANTFVVYFIIYLPYVVPVLVVDMCVCLCVFINRKKDDFHYKNQISRNTAVRSSMDFNEYWKQ